MKVKMIEIMETLPVGSFGDGGKIFKWKAVVDMDGKQVERLVKTFKEPDRDAFQSGREMDGEEKTFRDEVELVVRLPRDAGGRGGGGGGGFRGKSPEEMRSIEGMSSLKEAVNFIAYLPREEQTAEAVIATMEKFAAAVRRVAVKV